MGAPGSPLPPAPPPCAGEGSEQQTLPSLAHGGGAGGRGLPGMQSDYHGTSSNVISPRPSEPYGTLTDTRSHGRSSPSLGYTFVRAVPERSANDVRRGSRQESRAADEWHATVVPARAEQDASVSRLERAAQVPRRRASTGVDEGCLHQGRM